MTLQEAKRKYVNGYPLGKLTIAMLKAKAKTEDVLIYGDKAQILQCFDQSKQMTRLFRINKHCPMPFKYDLSKIERRWNNDKNMSKV